MEFGHLKTLTNELRETNPTEKPGSPSKDVEQLAANQFYETQITHRIQRTRSDLNLTAKGNEKINEFEQKSRKRCDLEHMWIRPQINISNKHFQREKNNFCSDSRNKKKPKV